MAAAAFVEEEVDVGVALPNFSIHQTYLICVNIIISSIVFHLFVRSLFFPTHPRPCHRCPPPRLRWAQYSLPWSYPRPRLFLFFFFYSASIPLSVNFYKQHIARSPLAIWQTTMDHSDFVDRLKQKVSFKTKVVARQVFGRFKCF